MKRTSYEMTVGVFVLIGILAVAYLAIRLGNVEIVGTAYYRLKARFASVSGLKEGARVEISGVVVGKVSAITLDKKKMAALVELQIRKDVALSSDTIASVRTTGLIGDKFIKISPGDSENILKPGGMITETESAVDLEDIISKYVFGKV